MASYAPNVQGSSIFKELPSLSSSTSDVYGSLLNNGQYVIQPNMNMDLDLIKSVMGWYYRLTGIYHPLFPDAPHRDCNMVFHPLQEWLEPDRMLSLAIAISENRKLPGMNLFYLHKNPE